MSGARRAGQHPKFPAGGKLTQYLEEMKLGDYIDVRGPSGLIVYRGRGELGVKADKKSAPVARRVRKLGMVAGGSGITTMLQIVSHVLRDPADSTQLWLLLANQAGPLPLPLTLPLTSPDSSSLRTLAPLSSTLTSIAFCAHPHV